MMDVKYLFTVIFWPLATINCDKLMVMDRADNETEYLLRSVPRFKSELINEPCVYCQDPLTPIYITPENVESVLESLSLPSMQTLKERKKPFSFFVEGIVGTGKTTLLTAFKV